MIQLFLFFLALLTHTLHSEAASKPEDVLKALQEQIIFSISLNEQQIALLPKNLLEAFEKELAHYTQTVFNNTRVFFINTQNPAANQAAVIVTGIMPQHGMLFRPKMLIAEKDHYDQWKIVHDHALIDPKIPCAEKACTLFDSIFITHPHPRISSVSLFCRYQNTKGTFNNIFVEWRSAKKGYDVTDIISPLALEPSHAPTHYTDISAPNFSFQKSPPSPIITQQSPVTLTTEKEPIVDSVPQPEATSHDLKPTESDKSPSPDASTPPLQLELAEQPQQEAALLTVSNLS